MRWNLSFNMIPYMLQENPKWQGYGHFNDAKPEVALNDRYAVYKNVRL